MTQDPVNSLKALIAAHDAAQQALNAADNRLAVSPFANAGTWQDTPAEPLNPAS